MLLPRPGFPAWTSTGGKAPHRPMNEAQFEAFYRKTAGGLWSYLYRLTGDPATADDLLQKAFFRFIRSGATFENDDHMRRYLYRTATNLVFDHQRESKRERLRAVPPPPDPARSDGGELRHDMMRTFEELKPRERALLWLAHVEEASHDEIAASLQIGSKSVRVLLFRARKRLAELLTRKGLAPEGGR